MPCEPPLYHLRSQIGDFNHNHWLFETKEKYGIDNAFWLKEGDDYGQDNRMSACQILWTIPRSHSQGSTRF
ncbi:Cellulose synthase-like protein D1 [Morella rubra]|uniref:Cellulose synthase-like protein D1 n=1 Tax=Morella rubra TaxID=262757 RepID=A0A6A1WCL0_9ROSI|nr:Cellulose synthase-like protein D1 [Morella rubra]